MNFMKTYARDGSMLTNLTPDRINTQEEFKSYYKEVFETIYTLDYLQGKAYLELTPHSSRRSHRSTDMERRTITRVGISQTVHGERSAPPSLRI